MNKIVFKINKNNLSVGIYKKDPKEEDLNNTNIINTKEIYFSTEYIEENLELVSSFLNVIILKQEVNKVTIKDYNVILPALDVIKNIPSIKELYIKPDKVITYEMFLKILENNNLTKINIYDIQKYLLERLDVNNTIDVTIRSEILFVSNFMDSNNLSTYSDIYYKKTIIINNKFENADTNDFLSFIKINKYLKQIEFTYFDEKIFLFIMNELINQNKTNIRIIFDEKSIDLKSIIKPISTYKSKNERILKELEIDFKIDYSEEYKKNNMFKQINLNTVKIALIGIILTVLLMMGINLYNNQKDTEKSTEIEKKLEEIMNFEIPKVEPEVTTTPFEYITPNNDDLKIINTTTTSIYDIKYKMVFEELKEINDDTIGWITVNNTNINYPVVQAEDNDYYLKRDYFKNKNRHGWIFMDYRNDSNNLSKNTIIYGHNLANQKMFGTLRYALNSSWYKKSNNQIITFNTVKQNMRFQIFSIYKVPVTTDYLQVNFPSDSSYLDFIKMITERSIYDFNEEVTANDKILTLSTCSNGHDQRLVVHAKLIVEDNEEKND